MAIDNQNMDDATQAYWQKYVDILQPLLRLRDWDVTVCRERPDNESHGASIGCFYGQKRAELCIHMQHFNGLSDYDKKVTIAHELMHLHTARTKDFVRTFCDTQSEETHGFFWSVYYEAFEEETETLAQIIAPFLPDPDVVVGPYPTSPVSY